MCKAPVIDIFLVTEHLVLCKKESGVFKLLDVLFIYGKFEPSRKRTEKLQ